MELGSLMMYLDTLKGKQFLYGYLMKIVQQLEKTVKYEHYTGTTLKTEKEV